MKNEEMESILYIRYALYQYISRAFAMEPDAEFIELTHDRSIYTMISVLESRGEMPSELQDKIALSSDLEILTNEYTRLFVGPDKLPSAPWESVYTSKENLIFQKSTLEVRDFYHARGYAAQGYPHEPDDHIATELSFMAALAKKSIDANAASDKDMLLELLNDQRAFLNEHLALWVNKFAEGLENVSNITEFYPAFAKLVCVICTDDIDILAEVISA